MLATGLYYVHSAVIDSVIAVFDTLGAPQRAEEPARHHWLQAAGTPRRSVLRRSVSDKPRKVIRSLWVRDDRGQEQGDTSLRITLSHSWLLHGTCLWVSRISGTNVTLHFP